MTVTTSIASPSRPTIIDRAEPDALAQLRDNAATIVTTYLSNNTYQDLARVSIALEVLTILAKD